MTLPAEQGSTALPQRSRTAIVLLVLMLAGLPAAVYLDMQSMTASLLRNQAADFDSLITSIRGFYSSDVVGRVLTPTRPAVQVVHNYTEIPGAIPLPATLSLELGHIVAEKQSNVRYRFVSDFPFKNRSPHNLDALEQGALQQFREQRDKTQVVDATSKWGESEVRHLSPVVMGASCVACHNQHPNSTKHDWKTGDVRGIQEVTVMRPVELSILGSFRYSLIYFLFVAGAGSYFIWMQRRQNATIREVNGKLDDKNRFLAAVSGKISRYLPPQVYQSIFSGKLDAALSTTRKKLTIFFSDVKGFTEMSERLQPEELTALINEYFTEMAGIALKHGGTIDKFIGDAILIFFGDPESKGAEEDARACMRMALEMQTRLAELNVKWRDLGAEEPFRIRIGINTGYCNVGNFGSTDRMDYTILGAEANLAARLQSSAPPDGIVVSYETYALVRDMVSAHALPPTAMKGISREVVPYLVEGAFEAYASPVIDAHMDGLDMRLNVGVLDAAQTEEARAVLQRALEVLDSHAAPTAPASPK